MPDNDGEVKLGITIDPSGATSGAKEVIRDVDGIKDSTTGAAEGGSKLVENLGSLRSAHHILQATTEIAQGGTEAIAGEAMAVRFLGEAFESLIPGGAALVALATVVSLGASMVARQQEHNEKLDDGKTKTDALKESTDRLNDAVEKYKDAMAKATDELEKSNKDEQELFTEANKTYDTRVGLLEKELDLRKQLGEVMLAAAEAGELAANKGGAQGALDITEKYAGLKQGYEERYDFQKLNVERQQLLDQNAALGQRYKEEQEHREALQAQLDALTAELAKAQDTAKRLNIPIDKDPKFYTDIAAKAVDSIKTMQKQQDALREKMETGNESGYETDDVITQELADLDAKVADATHHAAAAMELARAQAVAKGDKTPADIEASDRTLAGYAVQEQDNLTKLDQNNLALTLARQKVKNDAGTDATKDAKAQQELADKNFEAMTQAAIDTQQIVLGDKTQSAAVREAAAREIDRLKNLILQRTIDEDSAPGSDKGTPGEVEEDKAKQALNTQEGEEKAAEIAQEAARAQQKKDADDSRKQQRVEKADDHAVGSEAISDIQSLGGSRQQVEEAKSAAAEMEKGNGAGVAQLIGILNQLSATTKSMTDAQFQTFQTIFARLSAIDHQLQQHTDKLSYPNNSN